MNPETNRFEPLHEAQVPEPSPEKPERSPSPAGTRKQQRRQQRNLPWAAKRKR